MFLCISFYIVSLHDYAQYVNLTEYINVGYARTYDVWSRLAPVQIRNTLRSEYALIGENVNYADIRISAENINLEA